MENKRKLELVQHKAARFVVGNYNWNISSKVITDELGWQTLQHHRKHQHLKLMYRAVNAPGSIRLPLILTLWTPEDGIPTLRKLPYAPECGIPSKRFVTARAGRRYTCGTVYNRPPPEDGIQSLFSNAYWP